MTTTRVLVEGLGFPESTRWRDGRAWLCNWGSGEVLAVAPNGDSEVMARVAPSTLPFSIDWRPDGRLLVSMDRGGSCWCKPKPALRCSRISPASARHRSTSS